MYKLLIIIPQQADAPAFHRQWPQFLQVARAMPGLLRDSHTRPHAHLYGASRLEMAHEFFFEDLRALEAALLSETGQAAGSLLQHITAGNLTLLIAEHTEHRPENTAGEAEDA